MLMKICFVGRAFNMFSGTSKPFYDLATTLSKMGVEISFLTSRIHLSL